ncbi:glu S.griseus protease inhibitor-like [Cicer arietinum]|uniref:Glu S.griseus protease inhibitor-like n=1 Tax=Cicer arietinum TaxID=3827 RepID=A0A1S2XJB3_CICAR|nr:glu S.griseus protease inhibitor-like [Cicer arietinum]
MSNCKGKKTWPELVGINGEAASQIIMRENTRVTASTLPQESVVTTDFRCDRVRVFVDNQDIVTRVPNIG